ncbi:unnamed protein product [Acanthosepion pharaonis]|uniref:Uncharacterized protein n=1 Tax=Acanthosepion pharaonis TaxID=158019 RepID=A0A812CW06_ACAPH|nr:unnamed protein product [Sepia pharaonis]
MYRETHRRRLPATHASIPLPTAPCTSAPPPSVFPHANSPNARYLFLEMKQWRQEMREKDGGSDAIDLLFLVYDGEVWSVSMRDIHYLTALLFFVYDDEVWSVSMRDIHYLTDLLFFVYDGECQDMTCFNGDIYYLSYLLFFIYNDYVWSAGTSTSTITHYSLF